MSRRADQLQNLNAALLNRVEVVPVGLPSSDQRRESARRVPMSVMQRLGVRGLIKVIPGCAALLAEYSLRVIRRAVERAVASAVAGGRERIGIDDLEVALGLQQLPQQSRMH